MSEILPSILYQLGLGGIGGFVIGYTLKKISKFLLILMGVLLIFLLYLGTRGVININYVKLEEAVMDLIGGAGQAASWLIGTTISLIPFAGSFLAGFAVGFKLG